MWRHWHHHRQERWSLWEKTLVRFHSITLKHWSFDWPSSVSFRNVVKKQSFLHGGVQIRRLDSPQNRYQVLPHWRIRLCFALFHWKWYVQPLDEALCEESGPSAFRPRSRCEERREEWSDLGEFYSVLPDRRRYIQVHGVGLSISRGKISLNKSKNDKFVYICCTIVKDHWKDLNKA